MRAAPPAAATLGPLRPNRLIEERLDDHTPITRPPGGGKAAGMCERQPYPSQRVVAIGSELSIGRR